MTAKNPNISNTAINTLESLNKLSMTKSFLGREFLTWLWFKSETLQQPIRLESNHLSKEKKNLMIEFWIDDRIFFQPYNKLGHDNILRGGNPSRSDEATASLANGRVIKEIKIGIKIEEHGDYTAILNAEDLHPKSLQVPQNHASTSDEDSTDDFDILLKRLQDTEVFLEALDGLFSLFIVERSSKSWEGSQIAKMKKWVSHKKTPRNQQITH